MMIWNMEYGKRSPTRCVFGGLKYKMLGDSFSYKTPYTNKIKTEKTHKIKEINFLIIKIIKINHLIKNEKTHQL